MEDDEYKKLPVEERCVHKLWKARVNGYEEVTKLFRQIDDEKSPEFVKYLGLVKKFVIDGNAMGQEKGLEATLAYIENYANAGKTVGEVMSGIVNKCIAAPKTKTRELAVQVTLMYVEIEKQEAVLEELIKGMELKNPKIVAACINAATTAIREFGSKVVQVKPLVKKIPVLFADRDKNVRDEARALVIEMYRWIGNALRSQLNLLQPVQIAELEGEFGKIDGQKAVPIRYIRSQQEKQAKMVAEGGDAIDGEEEEEVDEPVAIDPYELADPVDILSKLPKDFFDKIEEKKWQNRKEALEAVDVLLKSPKLENGDYADLIRALKKVIQKDSNVIVVALAAKCLAGLATGLKKRFQSYASACVSALLEKFKEKKQNVVINVRDAIDAIYLTTTMENILEDVQEALGNKNPSVKAETAMFLARAFTKTQPTVLNKKLLKALTVGLIKLIMEPDATVRDCAADALGTLMKLVGDKAIGPFLVELEKDALKMVKIRECCEKAVIVVKIAGVKKERPATAPLKGAAKSVAQAPPKTAPAGVSKMVKRPTTAIKKKVNGEISSGTATIVKSKGKSTKPPPKPIEKELGDDEAAEIIADIISMDIINGLADSNWKTRLTSVTDIIAHIQTMEAAEVPVQAFVKIVTKKPGLKDTNFQVLKGRIDIVKYLASNCLFSETTASFCISDVTEKLGDSKNGVVAAESLTAIAEATSLSYVSPLVMDFAFTQKSPKVLQETLTWMGTAIKEFGFTNLNAKVLIDSAKKALSSTNPAVRATAVTLFGVLYLYMGPTIHMFLENEKQAIRDQINVEFEKYEKTKPPTPIRGMVPSASSNSLDGEDSDAAGDAPMVNVQDLLPRVDISSQITEELVNELADKNWKVRNEALIKVQVILAEAKLIKPTIGDLPQSLALRLVDSNSKIAQTALNICETIATAMGPPCKQLIHVLFPGFLQGLGDSKAWIRSASVTCMNTFGEQCGYKEFFQGEMVGDAFKTGSPTLRSELWAWLAEKLPKVKTVPKEEMMICIPHLYNNLEDRSADVRKNANEAVLGIMMHTSYETMMKQCEKLKPGSKQVIIAALDKARPNLPAKAAAPSKKQSSPAEVEKVVRGTRPVANSKNSVKPKSGGAIAKPAASRKKEEDVDTSPLLVVNILKQQRSIDEAKLKVLKWNFTQPREEFVEQLKDQMNVGQVNKSLIFNMFHSDFKLHIKAIESLVEDLHSNNAALISNLDLILKWLTLRFFDTNPSVLLKGLEYLHSVFNMLMDLKYQMVENEASAFIPYLILKVGDPKDSVRNGVRSLFKQIAYVYPISKLFSYIMDGLKSKNARQRAECLEELGSIIDDFGITVCGASPGACMKEVAKQIGDRDNSVRNAALNCMVNAYYIIGEKIFKLVGQISDKDMSLLEERIKRASKKPPPMKVPRLDVTQQQHQSPVKEKAASPIKYNAMQRADSAQAHDDPYMDDEDPDDDEAEDMPGITLPPQIVHKEPEVVSGPYRLDPELLRELDSIKCIIPEPKLQTFDLAFLKEDIVVPNIEDARAKVMPLSPPKPILPTDTFTHHQPRQNSARAGSEMQLEKNISLIGSQDFQQTMMAISLVQEFLQSSKSNLMIDYEDEFMIAITIQLKRLSHHSPELNPTVSKIYRSMLTIIDAFFLNKVLGRKVTTPVLKGIMSQFIELLVDGKLCQCSSGDAYVRVVNLHCVKIIERSDHTNIICALVQLLHSSIKSSGSSRLTDLVMKCLWRVIKIMPNWAEQINYDDVLLDVHLFFKEFPTAWWKNKPIDTPLRTIKTIIHSLAKIKGGTLMCHLSKIPNTNDSEMEAYILKLLKSLKLEEVKQVPLKTDTSRKSLSRSTHAQLTDIFQKIGSKEETKEGLNLLYDFIQQNPDGDIDPFLKRSSQYFQEYIQKNLQEIETQRKYPSTAKPIDKEKFVDTENSSDGANKGPEYYKQRLEMWQKIWDDKVTNK